jgi:maltokinase
MLENLGRLVAAAESTSLISAAPNAQSATKLTLKDCLDLGKARFVLVLRDQAGASWLVPAVATENSIRRAGAGDGVSEALLQLVSRGGGASGGFSWESWDVPTLPGEAGIPVDQTNESVIVGNAAVVKWQTALTSTNPASRILRALRKGGFSAMPELFGLLNWTDPESLTQEPILLASISEYLVETHDGWKWMVDDLTHYVEGSFSLAMTLPPLVVLGEITAQLHVALTAEGVAESTPAFFDKWMASATNDLESVLREVDGDELIRLHEITPQIVESLARVAGIDTTPLVSVHGDLHVGQFLRSRSKTSYAVIDFDGNPVASEAERTSRAPAAVDVASILQSIDHVGRIVERRCGRAADDLIADWIAAAQQHFLDGYQGTLEEQGLEKLLDERLLFAFRVRQELREFLYAVRHLPQWRYVPDRALAALMDEKRR